MSMESARLGEQIKSLRKGRMTQQELATAAGISVEVIRNLEQHRRGASVSSLHSIALALDVDIVDLFGRRSMPEERPDGGITALRQSVMHVDQILGSQIDPISLEEAERTETYLWGAYDSSRLDIIARTTPNALAALRSTLDNASSADSPRLAEILASVYSIAAGSLSLFQQPDAGFSAAQQAVFMSTRGNNQLLSSSTRGWMAWQLSRMGRFQEAENVASRTAEDIRPSGDVSEPQLSVYGSLLLTAATSAARGKRPQQAAIFLSEAKDAAGRISGNRNDYNSNFGMSQVIMQSVDVSIVGENYTDALTLSRLMPESSGLPFRNRARHFADLALAHTRLRQDDRATDIFERIEREDPTWIASSPYAQRTIQELYRREKRRNSRVSSLARRVGVTLLS